MNYRPTYLAVGYNSYMSICMYLPSSHLSRAHLAEFLIYCCRKQHAYLNLLASACDLCRSSKSITSLNEIISVLDSWVLKYHLIHLYFLGQSFLKSFFSLVPSMCNIFSF